MFSLQHFVQTTGIRTKEFKVSVYLLSVLHHTCIDTHVQSTHTHTHPHSLISKMLVVEPQRRSSLDNVANHSWLLENGGEEAVPLPTISSLGEIPTDELELHLYRMEQGGYGTCDEIMK